MKTKLIHLILILTLGGILSSCVYYTGQDCQMKFLGTIRQGPSTGLSINGALKITSIAEANMKGQLTQEDGAIYPVSGKIDSRSIYMVFELGNGQTVFVLGAQQEWPAKCQGTAGGTLTGPQQGDSGDWMGQWYPVAQPSGIPGLVSNWNINVFTIGAIILLFVIFAAVYMSLLIFGKTPLQYRFDEVPFVKPRPKINLNQVRQVKPDFWPEMTSKPIAQYEVEYKSGDKFMDMSFGAEFEGVWMGEFGVDFSSPSGPGKWVHALEVWMFDKDDINTVTKVIADEYAYQDADLSQKLKRKGELLLATPEETIALETRRLRLLVKLVQVEMDKNDGYFKHVALKIGLWV